MDRPVATIEEWWPKLAPATRQWLIADGTEPLPTEVIADIAWAGVPVDAEQWWVGKQVGTRFYLSKPALDWIKAVADVQPPKT